MGETDQGIELVREVKGFDFVRTRETELQYAQIYRKFWTIGGYKSRDNHIGLGQKLSCDVCATCQQKNKKIKVQT